MGIPSNVLRRQKYIAFVALALAKVHEKTTIFFALHTRYLWHAANKRYLA
jgi:hypothetical protein